MTLSEDTQAETIVSFYSMSKYLDDNFDIDNSYCEGMVNMIYSHEMHLNKNKASSYSNEFAT